MSKGKNEKGKTDRRWPNEAEPAYMTIEASMVIPVAAVLIATVLCLAFYLYTLCYLSQAAYTAAFRGSRLEGNEGAAEVEKELELMLRDKLINTSDIDKKIKVSAVSVKVSLDARIPLPVPGLQLLKEKEWVIHIEKEALKRDPVFYIWNYQRIE